MNDKQKRRLEIVSRIDDDIVEKNTQKRISLMRANKRKKWIISITSMAAALALIATTVILLVTLLGKQVPVYTGMTVSNEMPTNTLYVGDSIADFNAPGGVKGDQAGRGPVDQAKPFPEGKKPIGEAAKHSLSVTGSNAALYYAKAGEYVYITVHVDNPDSFEILSFTLNGYKYANNMFEYGSDLQNLILKVQIPAEAEGITSYTIDAIKYVDGEKIKDVRMDGDRTVDIAVYIEEQPTAALSGETLGYNSIAFSANVVDTKKILDMSESKIYAVLYDGDSLVATKELALGAQTVTFDGLKTNTLYQYAVIGVYDALDGQGVAHHVLASEAVYTKYVVLFDKVDPTPYSVSFELLWDEAVTNKTLLSLALYQGETKVRDLAVTDTAADGLASDSEYRLVATYQNGTATETIAVTFTTSASTVTFNNCGVASSDKLLFGADLPTPQRPGFTFAGWFTAEGVQVTTVPSQPISVFAKWAEEADASMLTYTVSGGKVTVTGLKADVADLIIPAYIEGCPVTKVDENAFKNLDGLESVHLPETLIEIDAKAFYGCTALKKIILPKSLKAVKATPFADCNALERVEYTGSFADWLSISFTGNAAANPVSISKTLYIDGVDITNDPPAIPEGTTVLGKWALAGFDGLTEVVIPDSVQSIGRGAFSGCNSVTTLTTPVLKVIFNQGTSMEAYDSLQYLFESSNIGPAGEILCDVPDTLKTVHVIGNMTEFPAYDRYGPFYGFDALTTVTLPSTLQSIGDYAFEGCTALANVNIPTGVTKIGDYAFLNTALASIDLPNGLLEIGKFAFAKTKLTEIVLPESLQIIQKGAFAQCDRVTTLTTSVLKVVFNANDPNSYAGLQHLFERYDALGGSFPCEVPTTLKTVHVTGNMTEFPAYDHDGPFYGFNALTTVTLPNTLQSIGDYAFNGCGALTTINIPAGVTEIGDFAFKNCAALGSVQLPAGLQTIGAQAFNGCSALTSINIPEGVTEIGMYAFNQAGLTSVHIPASMQVLDYAAFLCCQSLESVTFAANATLTIGGSAFAGCSKLTELVIPATVTSIECGAFAGCTQLENLTMPLFATASCRTDMCMGNYHNQFRRFFSSDDISGIANPTALSVTFTTGTAIPERYFEGMTGIIAVELPSTVTEIGAHAFSGCTALTSVDFVTTEGWWYTSDPAATSGTALLAADLENTATAATYLKTTYKDYYWKRS